MPRIITARWDIDLQSFLDENLNELASITRGTQRRPRLYFREKPLFRLTLYKNKTPVDMSGYASLSASIDNDFDDETSLMCKTDSDGINQPNDWENGTTANPGLGQVSVRLNADTVQVQTKLGTQENVPNSRFELKGYDSQGTLSFVERFPFDVYNLQDQGGDPPEELQSDFYTKAEVDALLAGYFAKRSDPVLITVAAGQNQGEAVVPGLSTSDLFVPSYITPNVTVSEWVAQVNDALPSQSKIIVTLVGTAPAGGATIYGIIFKG